MTVFASIFPFGLEVTLKELGQKKHIVDTHA
jgi:hypothetical protein